MISIAAIFIDWLFGDPVNFPHPVRLMGLIISFEEKIVRKVFKTPTALKFAGFMIAVINIAGTYFLTKYLIDLFSFNKYLKLVISTHIAYTCIAAKSLASEAKEVKKALRQSVENGRMRLKYIVGRNTDTLNKHGIIRAVVETVAENTSDGIIAPLFYLSFGLPFGVCYKMINTMDSMLGYNNSKYKDLGLVPARVDDLANLIPSRLTSLLMLIGSFFSYNVKNGLKITFRDHANHSSPNSGYPESTVAGLLGIQLGGGSFYENIYVEKPLIGDAKKTIRPKNIDDSINIMFRAEIVYMLIYFIYIYYTKRWW